jgi:DNA topoisomerase I
VLSRGPAGPGSYTLVICEKPDAARRVAEALSSKAPETFLVGGVPAFRLRDAGGKRYVICAAMGHLYGISDTVKDRRIYPALDLEWYPLGAITDKAVKAVSSRIRAIKGLSTGASAFVNACDLDIEGETIGYNILKYACGGKEASAFRARFSALTREEVVRAFDDGKMVSACGPARAGRLRHAIDFIWGVNLSRALSESLRTGSSFRTVSIGRVQGPSLNFVVEREVDVGAFVPTPYWTVRGSFRKDDVVFEANYASVPLVLQEHAAEEVKRACQVGAGVISRVETKTVSQRPPPPFNLADLQKEAFRLFGYTPSKTLQIAERLYLRAVVSYPRTGSQRLPKVDYRALLSKLAAIPRYSSLAGEVLSQSTLQPTEGKKTDSAHPAIYPTGESPMKALAEEEMKMFDVILRRFLACFGGDAVGEVSTVGVLVGEHEFEFGTSRTLVPGWRKLVARGQEADGPSVATPVLRRGDRVDVVRISVEERFRARPARYNQATLLEKMEREGIGTKATRADIISTLLLRGYVVGDTMVPTELGMSLVEAMREHCPQIISTRLTRDIEFQLERIEATGDLDGEFYEEMLSSLLTQISDVRRHEDEIAGTMRGPVSESVTDRMFIGDCPVCKEGKLRVIRSYNSGKRFVGCTNYAKGCRASAPLPQRGAIRPTEKPCGSCGWPVVFVRLGRRPWRLCVNDRCPRKVNVYAMKDLRKGKQHALSAALDGI